MERTIEIKISKKAILFLLAILGLVATVALAVVYNNANFNPAAGPSFCTDANNPVVNCDGVAKSVNAQFLGIPLAYWGMIFYVIVLVLLVADKLKNIKFLSWLEVFKNPCSYIAVLGLFSFLVSMILALVSFISLKMICVLCVVTYFINLFIALFASEFAGETFGASIKTSINDFKEALSVKKYAVAFASTVAVAVIFLTVSGTTYVFAPQVKDIKFMDQLYKMEGNDYADVANGNTLGSEKPKVVVKMYSDLMCPYCVMENRLMHKVAKDFSNVKIEFVQYPLDNACNKNIPNPFHVGACDYAKLALAAQKQGKFWDMVNLLFEEKAGSVEDVYSIAKEQGFDVNKLKTDMNAADVKATLLSNIDEATQMQVGGTPAFSVKGKLYMGLKPYNEVKAILIEAGAKAK